MNQASSFTLATRSLAARCTCRPPPAEKDEAKPQKDKAKSPKRRSEAAKRISKVPKDEARAPQTNRELPPNHPQETQRGAPNWLKLLPRRPKKCLQKAPGPSKTAIRPPRAAQVVSKKILGPNRRVQGCTEEAPKKHQKTNCTSTWVQATPKGPPNPGISGSFRASPPGAAQRGKMEPK